MPLVARVSLVVLLFAGLSASLIASDMKAVENQAKMEFFGKNLLMSHPYLKNKLHFNSSGALVGDSEEGTWPINGIIHVDDVDVKPNLVRVHGTREILTLRTENGVLGLQPILLTKHMEIEIEPTGPIASLDDVKQTVTRVLTQENLGRKMNEYWRSQGKITSVDPKTGGMHFEVNKDDGIFGYLADDRPVYILDPAHMVPPKRTHKEEAEYTKSASVLRTQGRTFMLIIINEKGYPELLQLVKELGENLDVQSMAATSQYRYQPAMKDGKPVACVMIAGWEFTSY
jgi:hypothetical protein